MLRGNLIHIKPLEKSENVEDEDRKHRLFVRFREDVFGLDNDAILKATRRFFLRKKTSGSWDKDKWTTQIQGAVGDDAQKVFDVYNAYMHAIIAVRVKAVEEWYDSDEELEDESLGGQGK